MKCLFSVLLLAALTSSVFGETDRLSLYGYYDFEVEYLDRDSTSDSWTFDQHHLSFVSIYKVDAKFRVFSQIDWEHGPAHSGDINEGKIYVAAAFADYKHSDGLGVRVGKFLTPFGIYNERHDATPTFLTTQLAHSVYGKHELSVGAKGLYYAKFCTGLELLGNINFVSWDVGYRVFVSNGRGENPAESDGNNDKGFGGRLTLVSSGQNIKLGASYYTDRNGLDLDARQSAVGIDLELDLSNWHLEYESIYARLEHVAADSSLLGNFRGAFGYYIMGARTIADKLTPFVRFEHQWHDVNHMDDSETVLAVGINYAVTPKVYLKSEIHIATGEHHDTGYTDRLYISSLAVAF